MRDLLRKCYKEVGIEGANAPLFQKRETSIHEVCTKNLLEKQEYFVITRWLLGEYDIETEECLVHIEEIFCEADVDFTRQDEKELRLLCEILVYDYSEKHSMLEFALMILCGVNIGKKLSSNIIYKKLKKMVDKERLSSRNDEEPKGKYPASAMNKLQKSIKEAKNNFAEEESFEYSSELLDLLVDEVSILTQQNKYLYQQNAELQQLVIKQREETDILWWIMNEWSELYEKPFNKLSDMEMAIAVPTELYNHSQDVLVPYAGDQIIHYFLEKCEKPEQEYSISEYLRDINDDFLNKIIFEFKTEKIEKVQCITGALYCMKQCGCEEDAWKGMFKKEYGIEPDKVRITPFAFANQFQRELELANYLAK